MADWLMFPQMMHNKQQSCYLVARMREHMLLQQADASQQRNQRPAQRFQHEQIPARECQIQLNAFLGQRTGRE